MKALLKSEKFLPDQLKQYADTWLELDVTQLHQNSYITKADRINLTDKHIAKMEDDARIGKGRCKFCGKVVERGHEEEHFNAVEQKKCTTDYHNADCFYSRLGYIGEPVVTKTTDPDDPDITIETTVKKIKRKCGYDAEGKCVYDACRKLGIEWFTESNTFFIKYPNGIPVMQSDTFNDDEWDNIVCPEVTNHTYKGPIKLKSYELCATTCVDNNGDEIISYFKLYNCRHDYKFAYDPVNELYIIMDVCSNKTQKNLINDSTASSEVVNKGMKLIMTKLFEGNKNNVKQINS